MNGKGFWLRWRGDIARGVAIFGVVVGGGLLIRSAVRHGRVQIDGIRQAFDTDFLAADRQRGEPWNYTLALPARRTLWLRNINGSISVEPAQGRELQVTVERTFKHSPVDSVRLLTKISDQGLTICGVWPGRSTECGPDGRYSAKDGVSGNDVALVFTVHLPSGVTIDASTINGGVEVAGAAAPVSVGTVNGDVSVETSAGPVRAATVNGDVTAKISGFGAPGDVSLTTVRGDAVVTLPATVDAVVDAHTVAGDISSDFPLTIAGKFASHSISGILGKGGRTIKLNAVTGDVDLRRADSAAPSAPSPPSAPRLPRRVRPAPPPASGTTPPRRGTS